MEWLHIDDLTSALPVSLWVELTSCCPFDCIFCSRRVRRGAGEHMDYGLYRSILRQLRCPEVIRLNYSGESIHYPYLIPAIEAAKATGAVTEMVSAFCSYPPSQLGALARSGLDRLSISLHTMDPGEYNRIYGFGSLDDLKSRIAGLREAGRERGPKIDFAFVAMDRNLDQLEAVADYARGTGVTEISVIPVIGRDPIPCAFPAELNADRTLRGAFRQKIQDAADRLARGGCGPHLTICHPAGGQNDELPPGAVIRTCEQNPWETIHILANGDVVACETHDGHALGNLRERPLAAVWESEAYREFRRAFLRAENAACRACPWKRAYGPAALRPRIACGEGFSPQLLRGWYTDEADAAIWSRRQSRLILDNSAGGGAIGIEGVLPPSGATTPNALDIECNGSRLGAVTNPTMELYSFHTTFDLPENAAKILRIDLRTRIAFRPSQHGLNEDSRDLGFALASVEARPSREVRLASRAARVRWLAMTFFYRGIALLDAVCGALAPRFHAVLPPRPRPWEPGISIVIPERSSPALLRDCLESVLRAARRLQEPWEAIVVVNGSEPGQYAACERLSGQVRWLYSTAPLSFSAAVRRGLNASRHDWVYLLNNDMAIAEDALLKAMACRGPDVFAVASQIFFKSADRMRSESNWTDFCLHDGVIELLERMPGDDGGPRPGYYAGGGSSLFRKVVLREMLRGPCPYDPFYWEDVEWGAAARRKGYRVVFCPDSRVWHGYRATISRFYAEPEIERIFERNGYLFQLRNLTGAGSPRNVVRRIAAMNWRTVLEILRPDRVFGILRARRASWFQGPRPAQLFTFTTSSKIDEGN